MTHSFTVTALLPASPQTVYDTWLDSTGHSRMTGSPAHASATVGDPFDAWDGHISGRNLELAPGRRIVQSWRAEDYTEADGHSRIEVTLEPVPDGTRLILVHSNIPDNQTGHEAGWNKHYFEPMQVYFSRGK